MVILVGSCVHHTCQTSNTQNVRIQNVVRKCKNEGIEFLTGVPAGELYRDRINQKETVNYFVYRTLQEMAEKARQFQIPMR